MSTSCSFLHVKYPECTHACVDVHDDYQAAGAASADTDDTDDTNVGRMQAPPVDLLTSRWC